MHFAHYRVSALAWQMALLQLVDNVSNVCLQTWFSNNKGWCLWSVIFFMFLLFLCQFRFYVCLLLMSMLQLFLNSNMKYGGTIDLLKQFAALLLEANSLLNPYAGVYTCILCYSQLNNVYKNARISCLSEYCNHSWFISMWH